MRSWKHLLPFLASSFLCFAAQPDRINAPINSDATIAVMGNVHGLAKPEFDQGRVDGGFLLRATSLVFKPSASQQAALAKLLSEQQNPASRNFHKWLTPAQFAYRFGMSQRDIDQAISWLQAQGLSVTHVSNSRNEIFFEGTVSQIEAAFRTEIHNYLVDGEMHFANATQPSVPAAFADTVLAVRRLHNFQPKAHSTLRSVTSFDPRFTSHVSGGHFIAPADFATLYDVGPLYSGGTDGTGTKIVLTGQSSISLTDVSNFRTASGLSANVPTLLLEPKTGVSTRCSGDEGESDLDVEWSGAVAKNASIKLVYAGLTAGETCTNRQFGAFDALQYAIDSNLASVISNSYGNCESAIGQAESQVIQGWIQQGNTQGQTIISSSGDSGAADCDYHVASATQGLAVDIPASIPEVTAMGGTEFTGDAAATITNNDASATTYWKGTSGGADDVSSAISYIPETSWNDSAFDISQGGDISASGGGASIYFSKPSWQTGAGVPADGKRDVPDVALSASADHDGYLICTEDRKTASCSSAFRDSSGGLAVIGGTSVAAPTFAGIVALVNQYLGSSGLGNINPTIYGLSATNPTAFHDVTSGDNVVPCTSGTSGCPATAPFQYGFSANTGYDQVTGLGSVDASALATAWATVASLPDFTLQTSSATPAPVAAGQTATATITIAPVNGSTQTINFSSTSCTGINGVSCTFSPSSVTLDGANAQTVTVTIITSANMVLTAGSQTLTITGTSGSKSHGTSVSLIITATTQSFTLASTSATYTVSSGGSVQIPVSVTGTNNFVNTTTSTTALPLTYTCTGLPSEAFCSFSPNSGTFVSQTNVTLIISTTAKTAKSSPANSGNQFFYAMLLPGVLGVCFAGGSRTRKGRMLAMTMMLSLCTLWLGACGSNSSQKNPGTPAGTYTVVVTAATAGPSVLSSAYSINLTVH